MALVKDALLIVILLFVSFCWQISSAYSQPIVIEGNNKLLKLNNTTSSLSAVEQSRRSEEHTSELQSQR